MFVRAISAAALTVFLSSGAVAGHQPGYMQRVSCTVVRYYVAKYSASTAEMWARSHGATEAQIDAARRCLKDNPSESPQAARWNEQ